MGAALLDDMADLARANSWKIEFNPYTLLEAPSCPWEVLRKALPALLEAARRFVSNLTDREMVEAELKKIQLRFDENAQSDIAAYGIE